MINLLKIRTTSISLFWRLFQFVYFSYFYPFVAMSHQLSKPKWISDNLAGEFIILLLIHVSSKYECFCAFYHNSKQRAFHHKNSNSTIWAVKGLKQALLFHTAKGIILGRYIANQLHAYLGRYMYGTHPIILPDPSISNFYFLDPALLHGPKLY